MFSEGFFSIISIYFFFYQTFARLLQKKDYLSIATFVTDSFHPTYRVYYQGDQRQRPTKVDCAARKPKQNSKEKKYTYIRER